MLLSVSEALENDAPHISVATGILVGLAASFVQSLGLTIQRKSHLQNDVRDAKHRQPDWKRPLWLFGFAIFISSNLLGTVFQIGALPLVVLGPLGAVSLLYNALFARIILGDAFTVHLVVGTVLIAGGAVMIGIFGTVPEQTHSLDELVALYKRPAFVAWMSIVIVSLLAVLTLAHLAEWRLYASHTTSSKKAKGALLTDWWRDWKRRRAAARKRRRSSSVSESPLLPTRRPVSRYGATRRRHSSNKSSPVLGGGSSFDEKKLATASRVAVGLAYGGASGTLSGLCLLFAKTGIELLIVTVVGRKNQFGHVEAWLIVLVLLVAAVLQLFYLNKALRLAGPTLVCPLAFCFYNLSSIASGLIFYEQTDLLSPFKIGMVVLGTTVLLAGVWVVALKPGAEPASAADLVGGDGDERDVLLDMTAASDDDDDEEGVEDDSGDGEERRRLAVDSAVEEDDEEDETDVDESMERPPRYIPAGLTIGLGASSPGFEIRPSAGNANRSRGFSSTASTAGGAGQEHDGGGGNRSPTKASRRTTLPPDFPPALDLSDESAAVTASTSTSSNTTTRQIRRKGNARRQRSLSGAVYT